MNAVVANSEKPASKQVLKKHVAVPDSAPKNAALILNAVLVSEPHFKFTDRFFDNDPDNGQPKQSMRVLRFLMLIGSTGKLKKDVLDARVEWERFSSLIYQRVSDGCAQLGIPQEVIETRSVSDDDAWLVFSEAVLNSPRISKRVKKTQEAVISCIRALDEIAAMSESAFRKEVERCKKKHVGQSSREAIHRDTEVRFPIGNYNGAMVFANVSFSEKLQPGFYTRLANLLTSMDSDV